MKGKIVKGIAGFYYVDVVGSGVYECKAKGVFRKEKRKPLVGDNVEIEVLDEKDREGNITDVYKRQLQIPGKKRMDAGAFLRGYTMEAGVELGSEG